MSYRCFSPLLYVVFTINRNYIEPNLLHGSELFKKGFNKYFASLQGQIEVNSIGAIDAIKIQLKSSDTIIYEARNLQQQSGLLKYTRETHNHLCKLIKVT